MTTTDKVLAMAETDPQRTVSCNLQIVENDSRSKQFACKLTVTNHTSHTVDILAINYRLGRGVSIQGYDAASFLDIKGEYDTLRDQVAKVLNVIYHKMDREFFDEYVRHFLDSIRKNMRLRKIVDLYIYAATGRLQRFRALLERDYERLDFPVANAADAASAIASLRAKGAVPEGLTEILEAKVSRMAAIESLDDNFLRPEYVTQLAPAEAYERIFVLKAERRFASIASYTASFRPRRACRTKCG